MIRNSKEAIENPTPQCEKEEVCTEYAESSWNEQEECYDQATLLGVSCSVRKTVTTTESTETWRYMTLEIDRNDSGVGFSASIDTDGDGSPDVSLYAPGCLDRQSGDVWGDFGGFTPGRFAMERMLHAFGLGKLHPGTGREMRIGLRTDGRLGGASARRQPEPEPPERACGSLKGEIPPASGLTDERDG